jgi:hypothetical protein
MKSFRFEIDMKDPERTPVKISEVGLTQNSKE